MDDFKVCDNCGEEFVPSRAAKGRFCSKNCAIANFRGKKKEVVIEAPEGALDKFMEQPEITHLRAGIRLAIRTAYERVHGRD